MPPGRISAPQINLQDVILNSAIPDIIPTHLLPNHPYTILMKIEAGRFPVTEARATVNYRNSACQIVDQVLGVGGRFLQVRNSSNDVQVLSRNEAINLVSMGLFHFHRHEMDRARAMRAAAQQRSDATTATKPTKARIIDQVADAVATSAAALKKNKTPPRGGAIGSSPSSPSEGAGRKWLLSSPTSGKRKRDPTSQRQQPAMPIDTSKLAQLIEDAIPVEASSIFHICDRRVNLDSLPPNASMYSLLRAWVQDDPFRKLVATSTHLVDPRMMVEAPPSQEEMMQAAVNSKASTGACCDVMEILQKQPKKNAKTETLRDELVNTAITRKAMEKQEYRRRDREVWEGLNQLGIFLPKKKRRDQPHRRQVQSVGCSDTV